MSIKIIDELEPKGAGGFPLLDDEHLRGSLRQVVDTSARDAIPSGHRKEGMFVFTQADQTLWVLQSDLTTWVEYISPVDVTGTPAVGDLVEVAEGASPFVSARAMVTDGTNLYIGQSGQGGLNSPVVWKVQVSGSASVSSSSVDLSSTYPPVSRVRDLSIDGSYLYAATWQAGHVAIIDISTMTVAGWAYVGSTGSQVTSVTTDGIGNIYAVGYDVGAGSPAVWKWSVASCLGQPPETAGPSAVITGLGWRRFIRAGGGKLWVSNGDGGTPLVLRIDPTTMTIDGYIDSIDTFTNVDVMTMLYLSPSSLCLVGDFDGNPVILSVNPNDPEWSSSHLITGFLAAQPPPPFYRSIANIVLGPDASGNPNQWLWVCETSYSALSGPRVGALDRNTFIWQGTITLNANDNAVYEGISAIGDYVFFARYKGQDAPAVVSTIDYRNPVSATTGSLTGLAPKFLQYASIGGDVSGTASSLTVAGLQGQPVSSSVPGSAGDLLTWDGSQWASASPPPASGTAGGDLSGSYPNPTVAKVNGISVTGTPVSGQVIRATSEIESSWSNIARGDITNTSGAAGDLITGDATTLSRLAIGSAGQVLTVSGGLPAWATPSSGNPPPAIDANHIYVWTLSETTGTFSNTGSGSGGALSMVAGVEGDDFVRGSRLLFKNYGGLRLMTQSVANVGARATDISFGNTECTIEGFYVEDPSGLSRLYVNNNPFNPNMSTSMPLVTFSGPAPSDYFMVPIGTEFLADTGLYSLSSTTYPVAQKKTHIMLSWASNILSYYVNGRLVHSGLFAVMNKAWTTVMIGGLTGSPAGASLMPVGEIAQVRISNIARTKSYAQAAYNTLLAM